MDFRDFLETDHPNKLVVVARDFVKSTMLSAYVIQRILQTPDIAFAWGHGVQDMAIKKSIGIRWHFEKNERLKAIAPDVCWPRPERQAEKWTEKAWTVRRKHARPDIPTFLAFGADNLPTSVHVDEVIFDDWEIKENSTNEEQIQKLKDSYYQFLPILGERSRKLVCGTPWTLYGMMFTLMEDPTYAKFVRPCFWPAGSRKSLWPAKWTSEGLEKRIEEVGAPVAASQYFLAPLPSQSQIFTREAHFNRRQEIPEGVDKLRFLYVDPEGVKARAESGCQTGFAAVLWGSDRRRYVENAYGRHLNQTGILDQIFAENEYDFAWTGDQEKDLKDEANHARMRLNGGVVVEVNMPTVTQDIIDREQTRRYGRCIIPVHEVKHTGDESKRGEYGRIAKLERHYKSGNLVNYPHLAGGALERQLLFFPQSTLIDIADALSMIEDKGWYPALPKADIIQKAGQRDFIQALKERVASTRKPKKGSRFG